MEILKENLQKTESFNSHSNYSIREFEEKEDIEINQEIIDFIDEFGFSMPSNDGLRFISLEDIPVNGENKKKCELGIFYGWGKDSNSIEYNREAFSDYISKEYLIIGEASPGDQICISLKDKNYGKIYYWMHDPAKDEKDFYLISENINDFMKSFFIIETNDLNDDMIDEWFSDEF